MKPGTKVKVVRKGRDEINILRRIRPMTGGGFKEDYWKGPHVGEIVAQLPSGSFIVRIGNHEFAADRHELKKTNA